MKTRKDIISILIENTKQKKLNWTKSKISTDGSIALRLELETHYIMLEKFVDEEICLDIKYFNSEGFEDYIYSKYLFKEELNELFDAVIRVDRDYCNFVEELKKEIKNKEK